MISHECKMCSRYRSGPALILSLSVRNKRVVFVSGDPLIHRSIRYISWTKMLSCSTWIVAFTVLLCDRSRLSHEDWSSDWGVRVLLTSPPSSGMIHNKNQDSLCRSACTACFLSFLLLPWKLLLYNWKHCNLSPHHMYDFNLFHVEMFLGWGGGGAHFLSSVLLPGYTVISDTAQKSKRTLCYDTRINYIIFRDVEIFTTKITF
jgi:hypothetical protein